MGRSKPRELRRTQPPEAFNALAGFPGRLRPRAMREAAVAGSAFSRSAQARLAGKIAPERRSAKDYFTVGHLKTGWRQTTTRR